MYPYPGFRYTLPVPTVRWVHFLYLKPLVCIPFSTGDRMSVLIIWYLHILGFRYRKCTLTIPTSSRTGTVTTLLAWCDSLANKKWTYNPYLRTTATCEKVIIFFFRGSAARQFPQITTPSAVPPADQRYGIIFRVWVHFMYPITLTTRVVLWRDFVTTEESSRIPTLHFRKQETISKPKIFGRTHWSLNHAPPPKNVERDIYEYVDRKNKDTFFTTNLL